ncbi:MAG: SxtJ family membrane protein [Rhodospirillaceae bacterium]
MIKPHHKLSSQPPEEPRASNRSVGLVLAVFLGLVGVWPMLSGSNPNMWALGIASGLLVLGLALPRVLTPLAWAWLGIGRIMHFAVSPIVLGLMYLIAVIPTGLYVRLSGKDPLRLSQDPKTNSYWISREPPGPDPKSLRQQF